MRDLSLDAWGRYQSAIETEAVKLLFDKNGHPPLAKHCTDEATEQAILEDAMGRPQPDQTRGLHAFKKRVMVASPSSVVSGVGRQGALLNSNGPLRQETRKRRLQVG